MKVKKIRSGKYRVYGVWLRWADWEKTETRYATKRDAQDFALRKGGYLIWKDFDNEAEAQAYLNEKMGKVWW